MTDSFDPFSDDPADEPDTEPTPAPKKTTRKPAVKKETTKMADETATDRTGMTLTFKGGSGFDAPWIVAHVADLQAADDLLSGENQDQLKRVMERSQSAGAFFASKAPTRPATESGAGARSGNTTAAPAASQAAPGGEERFCKHGPMSFKSGVSQKTGKVWKAFMCPSPKGTPDQCDAEWIR